jgi:hypothetical protein
MGTHAPTLVADIAALRTQYRSALALSITRAIIALYAARMARTLLGHAAGVFAMTMTRRRIDPVIPFLYPMTQ